MTTYTLNYPDWFTVTIHHRVLDKLEVTKYSTHGPPQYAVPGIVSVYDGVAKVFRDYPLCNVFSVKFRRMTKEEIEGLINALDSAG